MLEKYYFNKYNQTDLNVYRCGIQECKPKYTWGPGVRDHFIVHYILSGTGSFSVQNKSYNLAAGNGFVIFPEQLVTYTASRDNPWTYSWVGFHGLKAESYLRKAGFSKESPVFRYDNDEKLLDCLNSMISCARLSTPSELMLLGYLYIFLSLLIDNSRREADQDPSAENQDKYIRRAIEFISKNYSGEISIQEIALRLGFDRSYLYTIFKKHLNMSPQDFLIRFRIDRAVELMENTSLSIGDISRSVGYDDPLHFSKIFKRKKGISPSLFRKQLTAN
ncbi:MAG TPA: AraC family transcriptional regulator [Clostridia bacterium]